MNIRERERERERRTLQLVKEKIINKIKRKEEEHLRKKIKNMEKIRKKKREAEERNIII